MTSPTGWLSFMRYKKHKASFEALKRLLGKKEEVDNYNEDANQNGKYAANHEVIHVRSRKHGSERC